MTEEYQKGKCLMEDEDPLVWRHDNNQVFPYLADLIRHALQQV